MITSSARGPIASLVVPIPSPAVQVVRGFAMGAADIVPGVSGGTVALVLGIYERLIHNVHSGAQILKGVLRGDLNEARDAVRRVEWVWLISLLGGILLAVAALSSVISSLLDDHPVPMAGLFFGLVAGSAIVAWRLMNRVSGIELVTLAVVAVALFFVLGLKADTEVADGALGVVTQPWWIFFLAGALAICAMILPGISGSFILVMIGMYTEVLGAVNERDLLPVAATGLGCVVGLALFSSLLTWLLDHYHDILIAAMIGLMVGSLRVLWPWPAGTHSTRLESPDGQVGLTVLLAVIGLAVVVAVELIATRFAPTDD